MPVAPPSDTVNNQEIFKKFKSEKKFDRKVRKFKSMTPINGDKNCKYSVSHTYENQRWNFIAKLDCPSKPDFKMNLSLLMSEDQWYHPLYKWFDQNYTTGEMNASTKAAQQGPLRKSDTEGAKWADFVLSNDNPSIAWIGAKSGDGIIDIDVSYA